MRLEDFHFLLSPQGQTLLAETAVTPITPHNHLQIASRLRQQVTSAQAQAVLETILLRQKAAVKFSRADQMYFTRPALEQASGEIIAAYRAQRFAQSGLKRIADCGCGIGGDALALAAHSQVIGVDKDLLRLAMARQNVGVYVGNGRFHPLQADLTKLPPLPVDALFFDPARRDENGRRFKSVHQYRPPLSLIAQWRARVPHVGVKISPGVNYAELPPEPEIEFISLNGEVKEGALWFGAISTGALRRATLLPGGQTLTDRDHRGEQVAQTPPKAYLCEPDGAVIRAHLVQNLARLLNATQLDRDIAYLTSDVWQPTPFGRWFELEAAFPFQLKRLRSFLRERNIGSVTIKKRGSPLDPEQLQRQLRLSGVNACILFLTQVLGKPTILIGHAL